MNSSKTANYMRNDVDSKRLGLSKRWASIFLQHAWPSSSVILKELHSLAPYAASFDLSTITRSDACSPSRIATLNRPGFVGDRNLW